MKYIPIEEVQEGMVCNQTVYNDRGTLLIDRGAVINKAYIEGLKKFDIKRIAIQEKTPEKIAEAAEDIPQASPSLVTQQVISTCGSLLEEIEEYKTVKLKKHFHKMKQVIYSILEKPFMQACLEKEKQEDALYKHSLRTTLLAISMGIKKKYSFLNLEYLAMAAMLHDIGMGKQFQEADMEHSFQGFIKVRENLDLDMLIALVCLQHHERFDGHGGPLGLGKMQITEFARLISVADYYDRLIMQKYTPRQSVFKIIAGKGTLFDPEMVVLFQKVMY